MRHFEKAPPPDMERGQYRKRGASTCPVSDEHLGHFAVDGESVYRHACALGCEGIVSKRLGSSYRSGRVNDWLKIKNPAAPAVTREADEDWGNRRMTTQWG
jgi:hypothetical protein